MTGPEHYKHGEAWLYKAAHDGARGAAETAESCAAIAQAHFTAALAAATALASHDAYDSPDHRAWHDAASLSDPEDPDGGES